MGSDASRERRGTEDGVSFASRYRLGLKVGHGSFGEVFKATSVSNPKIIDVVKISMRRGALDDYWSETSVFLRETTILKNLDHVNIVKFVDAFPKKHVLHLVTERCAGGQVFEQLCKVKWFGETDAAATLTQMLLAIKYIHAQNVMHRDIKASNFLFAESHLDVSTNTVKMIDFGMSETFKAGDVFKDVCGSRFYISPEMVKGKYDYRIDMWSVGVLTYLLCCGEYPFSIKSRRTYANLFQPLVWKQKVPLSFEIQDFIRRILVHDPDERLTAEEALAHPFISYEVDTVAKMPARVSGCSAESRSSVNSDLSGSVKQAWEVIAATQESSPGPRFAAARKPLTAVQEFVWQRGRMLSRAREGTTSRTTPSGQTSSLEFPSPIDRQSSVATSCSGPRASPREEQLTSVRKESKGSSIHLGGNTSSGLTTSVRCPCKHKDLLQRSKEGEAGLKPSESLGGLEESKEISQPSEEFMKCRGLAHAARSQRGKNMAAKPPRKLPSLAAVLPGVPNLEDQS